ncbi:MAG: hypothetical protein N2321_03675 [Melioribacteraceae bacterium]|nr:hypothetical protein [Melioribacteraceae bacterium]
MNSYFKLVSILFLFVVITSCKKIEDSLSIPEEIYNNTPAVSITNENFSYAIKAKYFTKDENYNLNFTSDSVKVSVAASNLTAGSVKVEITLKDGSKPFYRNLLTNYALSEQFKVKSEISKVNITFTNFTGDFAFNMKTAY